MEDTKELTMEQEHEHEHHHHHEHGDECCCGHDHHHEHDHEHHHEHHHEHGEECGCGHDHHEHHHHHHEGIEISTHDESVIASVRIEFREERAAAETQLKSFMRAVAEETEALGGTIGHIKFFLKEANGCMFSMTDTEDIQKKDAQHTEIRAEGVAIVLGLTEEQLEEIVAAHYPGAV